jgi:hypothetical protein
MLVIGLKEKEGVNCESLSTGTFTINVVCTVQEINPACDKIAPVVALEREWLLGPIVK